MAVKKENALTVVDQIKVKMMSDEMMGAMQKIAPKGFAVDIHVINAMNTVKQSLKDCNNLVPASVLNAVYSASALGLSFNPNAKEAYLVPFNCKISQNPVTWGTMVTFIPGYKGLIKLCLNAGMKSMSAKVIFADDRFDFSEDDGKVSYSYSPCLKKDRGEPIAVLTVAKMEDGESDIRVLPYHKVLDIKNAAKSQGGPWAKFEEEMAMKTAIRRHCNQLPQSFNDPRLQSAIKIDEMAEAEKPIFDTPKGMESIIDADFDDVLKAAESTNEPVGTKPVVSMPSEVEDAEKAVESKPKQKKKMNLQTICETFKVKEDFAKKYILEEHQIEDIDSVDDSTFSGVFDCFVNGMHKED